MPPKRLLCVIAFLVQKLFDYNGFFISFSSYGAVNLFSNAKRNPSFLNEYNDYKTIVLLYLRCVNFMGLPYLFCVVLCMQDKLQLLAGQHVDILETLPPKVRQRVEILRDLQV